MNELKTPATEKISMTENFQKLEPKERALVKIFGVTMAVLMSMNFVLIGTQLKEQAQKSAAHTARKAPHPATPEKATKEAFVVDPIETK